MSDFSDWFRSVPFFTRYWFASTIGLTLIGRFGFVSPYSLILLYEPIKQFQIWRFLTCVLYYPLSPGTGFHFLVNLYFLYNYSKRLEMGDYGGKPADYLFMLVFNWICCVLIGLWCEMPLLMDPMVLSVLYIWCQLNKDVIVNFWFGTQFKAMYLPWVLLAFNMVINGSGLVELVGIIVGHLYFFLMFKYPQELGGPVILQTPNIFKRWFPNTTSAVHGFGVPPQPTVRAAPRTPGMFRGHNWGRGNVLGGN